MLFKIYNTAISFHDQDISILDDLYWYMQRGPRNTCRILEKDLFETAYVEDWKGSRIIVRQGLDESVFVCETNGTE